MPSLLEYLLIYYFVPSLFNIVVFYPSILNSIIPDFIKMMLPLESNYVDYTQFIAASIVSVMVLILGYNIYRKDPSYWLNKVFTAFYVGLAAAAISFNSGLFISPTALIVGEQFLLSFIMISLGLLLVVAVGLNYGEVQILKPKTIIPIIIFVALPLTVLWLSGTIITWLPSSLTIVDVSPPHTAFSVFTILSLGIVLVVGLSVLSYFLVKVYRASEGIVKRRIFFFLVGILFSILVAAASTSIASITAIHLFDIVTPLALLVGLSIVYYGFAISE
ncbi:MAG: hypothetical protein WED07_10270 [Candidatus Freyarchaeum deiterrae]